MKIFKGLLLGIILLGMILIIVGFVSGGSISALTGLFTNTEDYVLQDTITYTEEITDLVIDVETKSIVINSVTGSDITIDHYEKEEETWAFSLTDGTLKITQQDPRGIRFWFNFSISPKEERTIVINIPENYEFGADIKSNTGDTKISGFDLIKNLLIDSNTGDISVADIKSTTMNLNTDTGSIDVKNVDATGGVSIDSSTGGVDVENINCLSLDINVNTGDIEVINVESNKIDLDSDTGDVTVSGIDLDERSIYLKTDTGRVKFKGQSQGDEFNLTLDDAGIYLKASTNTGNVEVTE